MKAAGFVDSVSWDQLEHAYGSATDIAPLLKQIARARGKKQSKKIEALSGRLLQESSVYNASPPVVHALIDMLDGAKGRAERLTLYRLLNRFAEVANDGGLGRVEAAVREEILNGQGRFVRDLVHENSAIRRQAAILVVAFAGEREDTPRLASAQYFNASDPAIRKILLGGLLGCRSSHQHWTEFRVTALRRETDAGNRFLLRYAELCEKKSTASLSAIEELLSTFSQCCDDGPQTCQRLAIAVYGLGPERELQALIQCLERASAPDVCRFLAEQVLRLLLADERTGWGHLSYSRTGDRRDGRVDVPKLIFTMLALRLFPCLRERLTKLPRAQRGLPVVNYWGLQGRAPVIPQVLTPQQQRALMAMADQPALWQFRTNLWSLFGLPDNAAGLTTFVAEHR